MPEQTEFFRERVLDWGARNSRDFPWRTAIDPFAILISEVMLRRTRADQVVPVFERFISLFPTPQSLASAEARNVETVVHPLGLAWRAPAFQQIAGVLIARYDGEVPTDRELLTALPGVGDYVAAAVRLFAFGLSDTLVDTNTVRVAGRYLGFTYHADSRRNPGVRESVGKLHVREQPRLSGYALLDFAALICRAGRPECDVCPVATRCEFRIQSLKANGGQA
jgi:A/G-specific adenine glycosylase